MMTAARIRGHSGDGNGGVATPGDARLKSHVTHDCYLFQHMHKLSLVYTFAHLHWPPPPPHAPRDCLLLRR